AAAAGHRIAGLRARLRPGCAAGGEAAGRAGEQRWPHRYALESGSGVRCPHLGPSRGPAPRPAVAVLREEKRLDVLVNNAGLTGLPFTITPEGLEQTFATNYLGPFLLTNLLLDLLKASAPARVVNVSSFRHSVGTADGRYLTGQEQPGSIGATYDSTKLMNVLFTAELARRLQGTGVIANSLSPGVVSTSITRHFSWAVRVLFALIRPFMKVSREQGAISTIYCAVSEEVSGVTGKYFDSNCRLVLPSTAARDAGLARKLWEESERLTGLTDGPQH
uniref:Uncharacterized protein n=1 Tax=Buteo japonicus TaxID=224669 RepID=A0A8C0BY50_9AVES